MSYELQGNEWTTGLWRGLCREYAFFEKMFTIVPPLTFLVLMLALWNHPGPHGFGSIYDLTVVFWQLRLLFLACVVGMYLLGSAFNIQFVKQSLILSTAAPEVASNPPYRTDREKRPPRA
ncbi:hypothetical protein [Dyella sp. A6]|uniref:hypothetical protein n=1 Tax=Dyella aluminiiresistens TaxID=3069105 RepID=UPI002E774CBD|nr:hypothetical protein [Dyella sp. A6]